MIMIMLCVQVEHRALSDVIDFSIVTKADIAELDKLLVQFSKDLYQVFTFYSKRTNGSMSNGEFWRFVRDCKLGLKFTALSISSHHITSPHMISYISLHIIFQIGISILLLCVIIIRLIIICLIIVDLVFIRVTKTLDPSGISAPSGAGGTGAANGIPANELQDLQQLADDVARSMLDNNNNNNDSIKGSLSSNGSSATLALATATGEDIGEMSIAEQERIAEGHRVSGLKDITFQQFGEALIRLSVIKYPRERSLAHRFKSLLLGFVLPNASKSYNKNMSYLQVFTT